MHDHGNCARCDAQEERIARLEKALQDSTELLRSVRDENDEGSISEQVRVNKAVLEAQPPRDTDE